MVRDISTMLVLFAKLVRVVLRMANRDANPSIFWKQENWMKANTDTVAMERSTKNQINHMYE